uniref:Uncharacterized protein n=1 Tax=Tanacetum cinerariifolium TaxID=118510 RepID=A0A6L2KHU8_TANCI|nr:hypothetical protein [Tanacetum cinerariifolium]
MLRRHDMVRNFGVLARKRQNHNKSGVFVSRAGMTSRDDRAKTPHENARHCTVSYSSVRQYVVNKFALDNSGVIRLTYRPPSGDQVYDINDDEELIHEVDNNEEEDIEDDEDNEDKFGYNPDIDGDDEEEEDDVDTNRVYKPKHIMKDMVVRFGVNISYMQAYRGLHKRFEMLRGNPVESFEKLPYYCHNLEKVNPGIVAHIKVDNEGRFEMLFISIGVADARPNAYDKLKAAEYSKWSRAHCVADIYNYLTSNSVESVNSLPSKARKLPVTIMVNLADFPFCPGSFCWTTTYNSLRNAAWNHIPENLLSNHSKSSTPSKPSKLENIKKKVLGPVKGKDVGETSKKEGKPQYSFCGFIWGFKTWTLEVLPRSNQWWTKQPHVVPKGISWSNGLKFRRNDWGVFFGVYDHDFQQHQLSIIETPLEKQVQFWISSKRFFEENKPTDVLTKKPNKKRIHTVMPPRAPVPRVPSPRESMKLYEHFPDWMERAKEFESILKQNAEVGCVSGYAGY